MKKKDVIIFSYCFVNLGLVFCINEHYLLAAIISFFSLPLLSLVLPCGSAKSLASCNYVVLLIQVIIALSFNKTNLSVALILFSLYHLFLFKAIDSLSTNSAKYLITLGIIVGLVLLIGILVINYLICSFLQLTSSIVLNYLTIPVIQILPFIVNAIKLKTVEKKHRNAILEIKNALEF